MLGSSCPEQTTLKMNAAARKELTATHKTFLKENQDNEGALKDKVSAFAKEIETLKQSSQHQNSEYMLRRIEFVYWMLCEMRGLGDCKRYAMAPIAKAQRHHVRFDAKAFSDFMLPKLKSIGLFYNENMVFDTTEEAKQHMHAFFGGAQRLKDKQRFSIGDSYTTDGYCLCVPFKKGEPLGGKRKKQAPSPLRSKMSKEEKKAEKLRGCVTAVPEGASVVGIDMGIVNIYTFARIGADGRAQKLMLTRNEYYKQSGIKKHKAIVARKRAKLQNIDTLLSAKSPKSERLEDVLAYVVLTSAAHEEVWGVMADQRLSRSKWATEMGKQATLDRFVSSVSREFCKDAVSTVFGCGFPSFNCCYKGCPAAPTTTAFKALKRQLDVMPIDEYKTSKVCARCDEALVAPKKKIKMADGSEECREVRGIRLCPKCFLEPRNQHSYERDPELWGGFTRYDRDVNAALNIARVTGLNNEERPPSLQRIALGTQWMMEELVPPDVADLVEYTSVQEIGCREAVPVY